MELDMAWNLCHVLYRLQNVFSCIKSFLYGRACYLTGIRVEMNRRLTKTNASEQKSKDGCTHGRRIFLRARTSGTETLDALETFESLRRTFISSFRIHNERSLGGQWYARCKEIIWNIGGRLLQSGKQRYSTGVERIVRSCAWRDRAHKMQSWFNVIFCSKRCIDRNSSARVDLHQRDIVHDSLTRSLCRSEIVSVIPCNFLVTITNISSSPSDFYQGNVLNLAEILSTTVFFSSASSPHPLFRRGLWQNALNTVPCCKR